MKKENSLRISFLPKLILATVSCVVAFFVFYPDAQKAAAEPKISIPPGANYVQLWNQIDSLADSGLYRSAHELADLILEKARNEKQDVHLIKALVCRYKMAANYEEANDEKAIYDAEVELKKLKFPANQILHSLLAEMYWNYYSDHRWTIYSRSKTTESINDSINTWDISQIVNQTIKHYQASVLPADSLKKIPVSLIDDLLEKDAETRVLRPTLFDFLTHRAISFFQNEEVSVSRPAERFSLSSPAAFGDLKIFNNQHENFPADDTFALRYYAYKSYQKLLEFRLRDTAVAALIDADRLRLQFVFNNYSGENKNELYETALRRLAKKHPKNPESGRVLFTLAEFYADQARSYSRYSNKNLRWQYKKAISICDSVLAAYPNTNAEYNAKELRNSILTKEISFTTEEVMVPQQSCPALLNVRNMDSIYFRICAMPTDQHFTSQEERIAYYLNQSILVAWPFAFPLADDHQEHSSQIIIPPLASGNYVLLASPDPAFNCLGEKEKSLLAYSEIRVSDIAYLKRNEYISGDEYLLVNRQTGAPLAKATVEVMRYKYNSMTGNYDYIYAFTETADKDGRVLISDEKIGERSTYALDIRWKGQFLHSENQYNYPYDYSEPEKAETFFFLDRAIYRPGQTVFFKGIVVDKKNSGSNLLTNHKSKVELLDPNSQVIRSVELTTNEFGSFSGSFILPDNGITGMMMIADDNGSHPFSMEEYKRPKFEVSFDNIKGQFVIGDSITVTGKAKTFTGSPLDQATVRYTVERNSYYYWREPNEDSRETVMAEGTVIANDTGGFRFTFKAKDDTKQKTEYDWNTNFTVKVDVTDISGETHTAEKGISCGKEGLQINSFVTSENIIDARDSVYIETMNYDNEEVNADVDVKIYRLEKPEHFLRLPKIQPADTFAYSASTWKKVCPEDIYRNENEIENWKRTLVFTAKYNTGSKLALPISGEENWPSGMYAYETVVRDKNGKEIKSNGSFSRYRVNEKQADPYEAYTLRTGNQVAFPGEKAIFSFGTPFENANLLVEAHVEGKSVFRKWIKPGKKMKEIPVPITEECRGVLIVSFTLVHNNRFYTDKRFVSVPKKEAKQEIEIVFETFRNKLTPGQKEEWRLKIKGAKGEKIAAEMVAAMYDASLDEFSSNSWGFDPIFYNFGFMYADRWTDQLGRTNTSDLYGETGYWWSDYWPEYERFNWFGYMNDYDWYFGNRFGYLSQNVNGDSTKIGWSGTVGSDSMMMADSIGNIRIGARSKAGTYYVKVMDSNGATSVGLSTLNFTTPVLAGVVNIGDEPMDNERVVRMEDGASYAWSPAEKKAQPVKARKNLGETVFFYPHLMTDSSGTIIISFTMNEALSKWKLMTFAHTKDLRYTQEIRQVVTQKELMVMPNAPRFFREGDQITFTARLANLSDTALDGTASLELFDATTMKPVDVIFGNEKASQPFSVKKGKGIALSWNLKIPEGIGAVTYRVIARAGNFSDGEENAVPVLSNRILVTETLPLSINGKQTKDFRFEKLISQNGGSKTLRNEKLTLEFTSNPAWYAVQSLPYMMEYPYECAEQTFNRYYSNSLATNIANSSPKLRSVFDAWKNKSPDAFLSNLEKNPELKQLMLSETPWVLEAKDESERKRRVGLLFDANKMADETGKAKNKLRSMQYENGAWPWFENMPEDRYITQYIVAGFGHLDRLGINEFKETDEDLLMLKKSIAWMDQQMQKDYDYILKYDKANKDKDHLGYMQIQYLYARSFFTEIPVDAANKTAYNYYLAQAKKYWTGKGRYMEGMLSLSLFRNGETKTSANILKSLSETALHSGELGMYWKENTGGWYWHQASVETQSLLIEAFKEVKNDTAAVDQMRIWLLKNKQAKDWKTTRATADACYALLLDGTDWLATESDVTIIVGSQPLDLKKSEVKEEAGTGYFKTAWNGTEIKPEMGNVKVTKTGPGVSWGAMYWQYFEELDKITPAKSPMSVTRKLFLQKKTSSGIVLEAVTAATVLHPGDQLKVRIELKNDREMEYVHLKDMRASGFEPVNVFSQNKYQDGLSYYESTKDASTDFFFAYLPKGVHVFEYPLTVIHAGDFSMGIASAECMYAPEFGAHSEGQRVVVR